MRPIEWLITIAIVWCLGFIFIGQLDRQAEFEDNVLNQHLSLEDRERIMDNYYKDEV